MKVLIALDESPISARAAEEAVRLFRGDDVEFLVISVTSVPVVWAGGAGYGMVSPMSVGSMYVEPHVEPTEELVARAEAVGIEDPEPYSLLGDPVTLICRAVEEHHVDVIVVGSHDKSALRRLIDPSVASGVIRETYRPVLVVSGEPPVESDSIG
ncbi:MAG: universal stress protein [Ilumatobacteraceae bacterium]